MAWRRHLCACWLLVSPVLVVRVAGTGLRPSDDVSLITTTAVEYGVDPYFLATLRIVEAGGRGKEFGVLSRQASTYREQARVASATLRNRLAAYAKNPFTRVTTASGGQRLCYDEAFIRAFGATWAPLGVANDPHGLNRHFIPNAVATYGRLCREGLPPVFDSPVDLPLS
jgi:hypothetical protein